MLERLAVEMYARGLWTRDIEGALIEATRDRLLSRTAVSQATEVLRADYGTFAELDLSGFEVEYRFLDVVYELLRQQGVKMSEIERQQLRFLRPELGLLSDGTQDAVELNVQRLAA